MHKYIFILCFIFLFFVYNSPAFSQSESIIIKLDGNGWSVSMNPANLATFAHLPKLDSFLLSSERDGSLAYEIIDQSNQSASWHYPQLKISVLIKIGERNQFKIDFKGENPGIITYPIIKQNNSTNALIFPRWEGCFIPIHDKRWKDYLIAHGEWDTLEGLCMPFWGLHGNPYSFTYIVTNRHNNFLKFDEKSETLDFVFTHEFPPNHAQREIGFEIFFTEDQSPVAAAKHFREWLIDQGEFVTMKEKSATVPKVERLLGAAHVYLWGNGIMTKHDVKPQQWKALCQKIVEQTNASQPSVGKEIKTFLTNEQWEKIEEGAKTEWMYKGLQSEITEALSGVLEKSNIYTLMAWRNSASLPEQTVNLLAKDGSTLTPAEIVHLNSFVFYSVYHDYLHPVETWGDGESVKMLQKMKDAGFDRMRLCLDSWLGVLQRPDVAQKADEMGYLYGAYDSYHSIHDPKTAGSDQSWHTAQFDQKLYDEGGIVLRDGTKRHGFNKMGFLLNPLAARPYVEQRINSYMKPIPFNYFFMDCDAFGEELDDYSERHPATQQEAGNERRDRLQWIIDTYKVVMGSEGGSSDYAPVIHVAEGVTSPVIGWNDPERRDKSSPYYLGRYYPADEPEVFFKQVPLQEKYQYLYYDPRFRLPLYETVFHDSVVSTHHWSNASLKYKDTLVTNALTEILYLTPPLYHFNINTFDEQKDLVMKHYQVYSPLHKKYGFAPMTDFAWLTPDRNVQRSMFGDELEIVVNFGENEFVYERVTISKQSARIQNHKANETLMYQPEF